MLIEGISLDLSRIPKHVAIIMDGNRRWAKEKSVSILSGHREGVERVIDILEVCKDLKIEVLSLFAFSRENWKRGSFEIGNLYQLFKYFFHSKFQKLKSNKIRIIHSGIKNSLSLDVQNIIDKMVNETQENKGFILNLAINYSGRLEIVEGIKALFKDINCKKLQQENICEEVFQRYLFHPKLSEPDFLIRTSGEKRISNFLLWQLAYTELYFTSVLWPSFFKRDFALALQDYQNRQRRFGAYCV